MFKINVLQVDQVDLFQDNSLLPSNQLKTHKDFADCKYDFSLNASKLFLGLVSIIDHTDENLLFKTHRFTIPAIADFLNLKYNKRCRDVRKIINEVEAKKIILPSYDDEGKLLPVAERASIPILSRCQIAESKDFVEFKLNSELSEILLNPEIDTMPLLVRHMSIIIAFKTPRSIPFYFHLKKRIIDKKGKKFIDTFYESIENLKHIILMPDEYDLYPKTANFKIKVLDKIKQDLEENSDLYMTFTPVKAKTNGHPIIGYNFVIEENKNYNNTTEIRLNPVSSRLTGIEKMKAEKEKYAIAIEKGYGEIIDKLILSGLTQNGISEIIDLDLELSQVKKIIELSTNSSVTNKAGFIRTKCRELAELKLIQSEVILNKVKTTIKKEVQKKKVKTIKENDLSNYILNLTENEIRDIYTRMESEMPEFFLFNFDIKDCQIPNTISFNKLKLYINQHI